MKEGKKGGGEGGKEDTHRLTTRLTSFRSLSVISVFLGLTSWSMTERMSWPPWEGGKEGGREERRKGGRKGGKEKRGE